MKLIVLLKFNLKKEFFLFDQNHFVFMLAAVSGFSLL